MLYGYASEMRMVVVGAVQCVAARTSQKPVFPVFGAACVVPYIYGEFAGLDYGCALCRAADFHDVVTVNRTGPCIQSLSSLYRPPYLAMMHSCSSDTLISSPAGDSR